MWISASPTKSVRSSPPFGRWCATRSCRWKRNTRRRSGARATGSSRRARMIEIRESLKAKARAKGLWNFWLTGSDKGYGLTTVEYAYLAEEMGWSPLASESVQLLRARHRQYGGARALRPPEQKARWLPDLLEGRARSAYLMTEPGVASSDATNIAMDARLEGDEWVLNGEKWWSSGAGDPRCSLYITMALTDPEAAPHARHSMLLVPGREQGRRGAEGADGLWRRRRAARPHAHPLHRRARAQGRDDPRPRARLRDRAGAARPRAHPPLHARDRPGRAGARGDVPARQRPHRLRPEARRGSAPIPTSSPKRA